MKKQVLSIEQMQYLKKLGLDTSKASMVLIYIDDEGNTLDWEEAQDIFEHPEEFEHLYDAETGNYDHSYRKDCGVFTLSDILDLLPNEITRKDNNNEVYLGIVYPNYGAWEVSYGHVTVLEYFVDKDLKEAAYKMLCWCIEEGYIKTNKNN